MAKFIGQIISGLNFLLPVKLAAENKLAKQWRKFQEEEEINLKRYGLK